MLSRTAENLYWISRYVERAENTARLVDMAYRMAALPIHERPPISEWASILISSGTADGFSLSMEEADQRSVAHYLLLDPLNNSSVYSCLRHARDNARAVRTSLSSEVWEAINDGWNDIRNTESSSISGGALPLLVDWIKQRGALFRGSAQSTILRNDGYDFLRLGTYIERADSTSRLIDVKYHVLLPDDENVGGGIDQYQWISVLRAANSLRAYHYAYKQEIKPWRIAEFLILNADSPRSLAHCFNIIAFHLGHLDNTYQKQHPSSSEAQSVKAMLEATKIDALFQHGLHEFLIDFIQRNHNLSNMMGRDFAFGGYQPDVPSDTPEE